MTHRALVHAWNNLDKLRDLLHPPVGGGGPPSGGKPQPQTFAKGKNR